MTLIVQWVDGGREPRNKPDPAYPHGVDIDISKGAEKTCQRPLPYPARRCGYFVVACDACHQNACITTAGRADDPRSIKMACKS